MEGTPGLKEFDPSNETHVKWLGMLTDCVNMLGGDEKEGIEAGRKIMVILRNNPWSLDMKPEAFINIHAGMSIKYAGNVLDGTAWVPSK
tara:strand:+ start:465 stop:731 length:267 start_codon:yes stop_codon:yes gene_type:complete